jgi:hypothetical protein
MRITIVYFILSAFAFSTFLTGCVSVSLSGEQAKKAKDFNYEAPAAPFVELKNETVDKAWLNQKNGNTMAFLSECGSKHEPSLKTMEAENLSALTNLQILDSKNEQYNDRESIETTAKGQVDGIPINMTVLLFKKNSCNFTITYVGRQKVFADDIKKYKQFKEKFKVP